MKIYPYNMVDVSISIYQGGEESGYPIENLNDPEWNAYWQNDNNNEVVIIDLDLGSTMQPDYLILANHNLTDTSYGIKLQYGTGGVGGSFSSAGYLVGSAGAYHDYVSGNDPIWYETFTAPGSAYQYYRLTIEDKNGTKPYIGVISLGIKQELASNYSLGGSRGNTYGNTRDQSDGGIIYANNDWDAKKEFDLSYDDFEEADKTIWDTIMGIIKGSLYPFFIQDLDDSYYYVRLMQDSLPFEDVEYQIYSNTIALREEN